MKKNGTGWRPTDHLIGLFIGWTWLDFSGGVPAESGRWCFTVAGAQRDWEETGPWRKLKEGHRVRGAFILRRDKVAAFLAVWDRLDSHEATRVKVRRAILQEVS